MANSGYCTLNLEVTSWIKCHTASPAQTKPAKDQIFHPDPHVMLILLPSLDYTENCTVPSSGFEYSRFLYKTKFSEDSAGQAGWRSDSHRAGLSQLS